jgi:hypothetical protein
MTTEIAVRPTPIAPVIPEAAQRLVQWAQAAQAAYDLAQRLITTSFAPVQYKGKPDEAAAAILAGSEVGLSPLAALRAFDVIQGTAAPRALTLRAILQSLGHDIVYDEQTPERVTGRGRRKGSTEWQHAEWTIQRATQLGLTGKEQWKKQPQTMLVARLTSELARMIAADAILGIPYTAEELRDSDIIDAVPTRPRVTAADITRRTPDLQHKPDPPVDHEPEPVEPSQEPPADVTDASEPINPQQMKYLHTVFSNKGFAGRDDRLSYIKTFHNIDVESTKDLTAAEAQTIVTALKELPA